jgi:hypothetical protein
VENLLIFHGFLALQNAQIVAGLGCIHNFLLQRHTGDIWKNVRQKAGKSGAPFETPPYLHFRMGCFGCTVTPR